MTTGLLIPGQIGHLSFSGSSGLRLLPLLRGPVSRCALLLRFEVGGPPLEFFRYVHELKAARIIPGEFLCQPQARFGPVSEILCIHDASSCAYKWSKITADLEGGCSHQQGRLNAGVNSRASEMKEAANRGGPFEA